MGLASSSYIHFRERESEREREREGERGKRREGGIEEGERGSKKERESSHYAHIWYIRQFLDQLL